MTRWDFTEFLPNGTYRGNMIHVWLLDHRAHGVLDRSILKFIVRVLLPNLLQVKIGTVHPFLQKS